MTGLLGEERAEVQGSLQVRGCQIVGHLPRKRETTEGQCHDLLYLS